MHCICTTATAKSALRRPLTFCENYVSHYGLKRNFVRIYSPNRLIQRAEPNTFVLEDCAMYNISGKALNGVPGYKLPMVIRGRLTQAPLARISITTRTKSSCQASPALKTLSCPHARLAVIVYLPFVLEDDSQSSISVSNSRSGLDIGLLRFIRVKKLFVPRAHRFTYRFTLDLASSLP